MDDGRACHPLAATLPHLIGRVDAKAERSARRLEVPHVHFEQWFHRGETSPLGGPRVDRDAALAGVADALTSLAAFVGAADVRLARVTPHRLRAPLARRLRASPKLV